MSIVIDIRVLNDKKGKELVNTSVLMSCSFRVGILVEPYSYALSYSGNCICSLSELVLNPNLSIESMIYVKAYSYFVYLDTWSVVAGY